jgi:hypothetical protein
VADWAKISRSQRDALYSDLPENHEQHRNAPTNCTTLQARSPSCAKPLPLACLLAELREPLPCRA